MTFLRPWQASPPKHKMATKHIHEQECIPVGCVPSALNRRGVSLTATPLDRDSPPVDRQTSVKIFPCSKLRLRTVIMDDVRDKPSYSNSNADTAISLTATYRIMYSRVL